VAPQSIWWLADRQRQAPAAWISCLPNSHGRISYAPSSQGFARSLVVKIKRKSPEHPPQFQGVLRLAEGSKRLILSTSVSTSNENKSGTDASLWSSPCVALVKPLCIYGLRIGGQSVAMLKNDSD
jgi:hypothetical protein